MCSEVRLSSQHIETVLTGAWYGCGQSSCQVVLTDDETSGHGSDEPVVRDDKKESPELFDLPNFSARVV